MKRRSFLRSLAAGLLVAVGSSLPLGASTPELVRLRRKRSMQEQSGIVFSVEYWTVQRGDASNAVMSPEDVQAVIASQLAHQRREALRPVARQMLESMYGG